MKKNSGFPQHLGQGGSLVTIYAPTRALKYFRISYRVGAKRRQRTFRTLEAAQREAEALQDKLRTGEPSVANISTLEVAMLHTAKEELVGLEVRLDRACSEYARAIKRLGDTSLEEAVGFYLEHHPTGLRDITLGDMAKAFQKAKEEAGVSSSYLNDLRNRTNAFARQLDCRAGELTAQKVADYFGRIHFKPENHNNQLRVLRTFFRYGQSQGFVPEEVDLLKGVTRKQVRRGDYSVYQPNEFLALLEGANREMVPALVLLGFLGVRPNEMRRLQWKDVRINTRTLVLDAYNSKTASRRTVPICEAALMWLRPYEGQEGLIWRRKADYWNRSLKRLHQRVGVKQQPNGLRHSYISYRLTLSGDVNRTALEAGNSAAMIHSHYHALVEDPQLANQWFEVGLGEVGGVLRVVV